MTSRFSGALQLTNLDDFINPSQECIKPVEIKKSDIKTGSKIKIQEDGYVEIDEKGDTKQLEKVGITLADCLACSGCITSAESVLITQQSQEEILRVFEEKKNQQHLGEGNTAKHIVVSLSIQPILSLAERYGLEPNEAALKLAGYFTQLGADAILDMTVAEDFALLESAREFLDRFKSSQEGAQRQLPMLSSSCPGWVCYAEKTHGNFILPYISVTKSPQQIMGSLVKYHYGQMKNLSPENIYHITVMPCYDKKLEASRQDFYNQLKETRDVDCVITTIEIEQMLHQEGLSLQSATLGEIQRPFDNREQTDYQICSHNGSGSGGYADFIYRYAAEHLFQNHDAELKLKNLRNPDFQEGVLEKDGKILLRFAIANGFRNIQNLVQKLKKGKSNYDFVEIMACPSGCLNGGAQIKGQSSSQPRELIMKLEEAYHKVPQSNPEENPVIKDLYKTWLEGEYSDKSSAFFHTQYHEIEKMSTALNIKW
ncbi:probable cytosolic Fe-S cluster assembly factor GK14772 [Leptopilina heterotoma]|uniref:probable cytosolic Fe-S cluster assembly factor GK14772 n=1 Tax=Leptopilina heterotoma TaxID=63436 RepID=UPI001CA9C129|nr:probable cytosolic Fe-S cluster assembly factor GK14772 [Leptopilina heterotoma]